LIKFCENFSLGSSLNQSRTYQGNPVAFTLNYLPSLEVASSKNSVTCIKRSAPSKDHIKNSVTYIKQSAPRKDHIIWYQSQVLVIGYILSNFFSLCNLSQVRLLLCYLHSCSHSCLHLVAFCYKFCLGTIWLTGRI